MIMNPRVSESLKGSPERTTLQGLFCKLVRGKRCPNGFLPSKTTLPLRRTLATGESLQVSKARKTLANPLDSLC